MRKFNRFPSAKKTSKSFLPRKTTLSAAIAAIALQSGLTEAATLEIIPGETVLNEDAATFNFEIDAFSDIADIEDDLDTGCTISGTLSVSGSATEGEDFTLNSNFSFQYDSGGALSRPTAARAFVTETIIDDTEVEGTEDFTVSIDTFNTNCNFYSGLSLGANSSAEFTIIDNDETTTTPPDEDDDEPNARLSPEAEQVLTSMGTLSLQSMDIQTQNLSKQLRRLRQGLRRANDLSGLMLDVDGQMVSGNQLNQIMGAGAGDEPLNSKWGSFIGGSIKIGDQESTNSQPDFDFNVGSLFVGVDYKLNDSVILGSALGYTNSSVDIAGDAGETNMTGLSLGVFASYYYKDLFYVDSILSYGNSDYETERNITVGNSTVSVDGETEGNELSLAFNTGHYLRIANYYIHTYGSLNYIDASINAYNERGAGSSALSVDDQDLESLTTNMGAEITWNINTAKAVVSPYVSFDWEKQYIADAREISGSILGDNSNFSFDATRQDHEYFNAGLGLSAVFQGGLSAYITYEVDLDRDDFNVYDIALGGRWEF